MERGHHISSAAMFTVVVLFCILNLASAFPGCSAKYKEECSDKICKTVKQKYTTTVYEEECTTIAVHEGRNTRDVRSTPYYSNPWSLCATPLTKCYTVYERNCTMVKDEFCYKRYKCCETVSKPVTKQRNEWQKKGENCFKWAWRKICLPKMVLIQVTYTDYEEVEECGPVKDIYCKRVPYDFCQPTVKEKCKIVSSKDICWNATREGCPTVTNDVMNDVPQDRAQETNDVMNDVPKDVPKEDCKLVPRQITEFREEEKCKTLKKKRCKQVKRDPNDMSSLSCMKANHFSFYGFNSNLRLF